ncbi:hypothetical protein [Endozoicomonas sp. ALC020]|uniref:hypothetical protein n=1 Tax=unclassified Endozoicomonas TaxID=2644528 RepID=UPI003BAE237C
MKGTVCFKNVQSIAIALRRGDYNYISLESALSEYGAISQIPVDRLTIMTTGRKGEYKTPFGVLEFTHTRRSVADILDSARASLCTNEHRQMANLSNNFSRP